VGTGQEWIYYAINKFIDRDEFIDNKMSIRQNIDALKAYLKLEAQERGVSKFLNKFEDSHYLSWLESALIVKFQLHVNRDYVIVDDAERKIKKGIRQRSKAVKILMNDGKVSPDSVFGNGIQQLLYARLNTQNKR